MQQVPPYSSYQTGYGGNVQSNYSASTAPTYAQSGYQTGQTAYQTGYQTGYSSYQPQYHGIAPPTQSNYGYTPSSAGQYQATGHPPAVFPAANAMAGNYGDQSHQSSKQVTIPNEVHTIFGNWSILLCDSISMQVLLWVIMNQIYNT